MRSPTGTSPPGAGASRDTGAKFCVAIIAWATSSLSTCSSSATSATVGSWCSVWLRSEAVERTESTSSWMARGGRTPQPWSRKCFLRSPAMLGAA